MNIARSFESQKLVRFQHCDPAGIVFYPQYFVLFHELIEDWFNDGLRVNYAEFIAIQKLGVPTVHMEVDFVAPSKIGERLRMQLAVKRIGTRSIVLSLAAFADDALRVQIQQTIVLFSLERRESVAIPDDLRQRLSLFLAEETTQ
ncbi:acyl-CoA thioesterase [Trinickia symbiotica]|uniref:Acyl-CoA thioesterase n=1 Tax=Trinickia symbiotica TaxID=863227 RepID=A0A2T3XZ71_9BURK|nr:thioesterase family protein [Trinickia symbiotica]PTB21820.1 acyl-CoA thioesterase [Trinickia symbiotica]